MRGGMPHGMLALAAVLAAAGPSPAMTFADGDFDPANWSFVQIEQNEGGSITSAVDAEVVSTGFHRMKGIAEKQEVFVLKT